MSETTLELRKIKIVPSMSRETIAYSGELWVNGKRTAELFNDGGGGSDEIHIAPDKSDGEGFGPVKQRLQQAYEYCLSLPDEPSSLDGYPPLKMNLELWISLEVGKIDNAREAAKFKKKMEKAMLNMIVVGTDNSFSGYKFNMPIADYLRTTKGVEVLKQTVRKAKKELKEGERILNTNLPDEIMQVS